MKRVKFVLPRRFLFVITDQISAFHRYQTATSTGMSPLSTGR
ncbi:unnamed protein product [Brassica oleracea]